MNSGDLQEIRLLHPQQQQEYIRIFFPLKETTRLPPVVQEYKLYDIFQKRQMDRS